MNGMSEDNMIRDWHNVLKSLGYLIRSINRSFSVFIWFLSVSFEKYRDKDSTLAKCMLFIARYRYVTPCSIKDGPRSASSTVAGVLLGEGCCIRGTEQGY